MATLVIVESPTKAKTIGKFLGRDFRVVSSMGHVRDLPKSDMGIDIEGDTFLPKYEVSEGKTKTVKELKTLAKDAEAILLATDEDREGEAISWHLAELLKIPTSKVERLVFHEITKHAIEEALKHPRPLNMHLVDAQQARRVLDRLVGYELSPLLWRKVRYGLSAGRVQSAAVHLLVEREKARAAFKKAAYADIVATVTAKNGTCEARLVSYQQKSIPSGVDFDETTGMLKKPETMCLLTEASAETLAETLFKTKPWTVTEVTETPYQTHAYAPFTTSTLQQDASRKLGLSAKQTMRTAQALYENGYITYMRTDSTHLSDQAIQAAREAAKEFGETFVSDAPKQYATKDKNAQEAHEAIRPAGATFRHPKDIANEVQSGEAALYELIWKRTVATQMKSAQMERIAVTVTAGEATFETKGKRIIFPGYLRAYVEGTDNPEEALEHSEVLLPQMVVGEVVVPQAIRPDLHSTEPPARFTEASLIKALEANGVGRPSTYASIMDTILEREYALKQGNALVPTFTACIVDAYLQAHFPSLVDVHFTATMEEDLDRIAAGEEAWQPYIKTFYHGGRHTFAFHPEVEKAVKAETYPTIPLGVDPKSSEPVIIKSGKFGPYLQRGEGGDGHTTSIPEGTPPAELTLEKALELLATPSKGTTITTDPETGLSIVFKQGRFGPYLERGEKDKDKAYKTATLAYGPKHTPISAKIDIANLTPEMALLAMTLPRTLGEKDGESVLASVGRFGPYLKYKGEFRSIPKEYDLLTITLDEAFQILATPKVGRGTRTTTILKDLGIDPSTEKPLRILDGKYGPYISNGTKVFASIPKDRTPDSITVEEALTLLQLKSKTPTKTKKRKPRAKKKSV